MKKLLPFLTLLLWMLMACTPSGESIVSGVTDPSQYYTYTDGDKYTVGEFAQTTEEIKGININWISGSVYILGEDRAGVSVREDYKPKEGYEPYSVHTYIDGGILYIRFMRVNLRISTTIPTKELTVIVPRDVDFDKISVTTGTAKCVVSDIICQDFAFDSGGIGAGLSTEGCTYKSFFSNVTSGDTIIRDCTFSEKTEFMMNTGSIVMEDSETVLLKGQCRTGDVVLQNTSVTKADADISLTGDAYFTDLDSEDFSLTCATGDIHIHLSPEVDLTDCTLDLHSPHDILYPEEYEESTTVDRPNRFYLRTTTGKIKFSDKETVEGKIEKIKRNRLH